MKLGNDFHTLVLEEQSFFERCVQGLDMDGRKKEVKEFNAAQELEGKRVIKAQTKYNQAGDLDIWKPSDWFKIHEMNHSINNHTSAKYLLKDAEGPREATLVWTDTVAGTGAHCKARMDRYVPEMKAVVDLKSAADASKDGFRRAITKYGYDIQAAWYTDGAIANGLEVDGFIFVAIEKQPPYAIGTYLLKMDWIEAARADYIKLLEMYEKCKKEDKWPAYDDTIVELDMPKYRKPVELVTFEEED